MKVARWKVLGLAGVLALGYVASVDAAQIKVSDDTWADFGFAVKVWYYNLDERGKSKTDVGAADWSRNVFDVGNTRIYAEGQVNKLVQFYTEVDSDSAGKGGRTSLHEAGVNFAFAKEFQILAGLIRKSFTRADLTEDYAQLIPTGYFYDPQNRKGRNINLFTYEDYSTGGAMIHGDLFNSVITYRIGAYDTANRNKQFRDVEWNARVEFQPLMLGFKPESAATITSQVADTYLGKKDVFTIGVGYRKGYVKKGDKDDNNDGWTIDATFEKKFGCFVPNIQVGYVKINDSHVNGFNNYKTEDSDAWYAQAQFLYDQVVGIGKPALAIRYDTTTNDKAVYVPQKGRTRDAQLDRWGVALNYYIKGQAARVALGYDYAKYRDGSKDILKYSNPKLEDSISDWYLYIQTKF